MTPTTFRILSIRLVVTAFIASTASFTQAQALLQAENATLTGNAHVSTAVSGYSGTGYVNGLQSATDTINWSFTNTPGLYDLIIRFRTAGGAKGYAGSINGYGFSGMFPATNVFSSFDAGLVQVIAGTNTLQIGGGWSYYEIDAVLMTPVATPLPPAPVPATLTDPLATFAARSLMANLVADYGKHTWAGQNDLSELPFIQSQSGRLPAIVEGDLMNYSPSRVYYQGIPQANNTESTESYMKLDKTGYVVGFCWHWNAPTNLLNTGSQPWYKGFYTTATTFDVSAALANTNSVEYSLLLRDIDAIAVQLRKLSSNNVPVLWRPLHEASGGWFWWGAKGPEPFKALWRLLYSRLTTYNNLHNLIWVLVNEDPAWYPGDDVVDIVGIDAYPDDVRDTLSTDWQTLQTQFSGKKLLALTEFGGVPDAERMHTFGVWWSYFAPWNGTFIEGAPPATISRIYQSQEVVTLDELNAQPPVITSIGLVTGGAFQLSGTGPHGAAYRILAATNLALPISAWSVLTNSTFSGGVFSLTNIIVYPQRYYRVAQP